MAFIKNNSTNEFTASPKSNNMFVRVWVGQWTKWRIQINNYTILFHSFAAGIITYVWIAKNKQSVQ